MLNYHDDPYDDPIKEMCYLQIAQIITPQTDKHAESRSPIKTRQIGEYC